MKFLIIILLLSSSMNAIAIQKRVSCSKWVNGLIVETINDTFDEDNTSIDFTIFNAVKFFVESQANSHLIELNILDTETMRHFFTRGAISKNGEGVSIGITHKNDNIDLKCEPQD